VEGEEDLGISLGILSMAALAIPWKITCRDKAQRYSTAGYVRTISSPHDDGQLGLRLNGGFFPASGGHSFGRKAFVRKLNHHELGDEFLRPMCLEINGGTFSIRLGYYTESVLKMPDAPAFWE
jgi:hypothetical protein